ncbi:SGNH/GDSL hydrolase family protein [Bacillus sp. FJAT-47783]|uniref:SGNH/GDSL hydrolase family protein n=1 Tax=Bacillus sp. FJAT-47783 TaxID=2922712 RepID=UPI001FAC2570|nr:SGNH/GDSL hydrolase family protein [Bacillus sp. FJAT-47783]
MKKWLFYPLFLIMLIGCSSIEVQQSALKESNLQEKEAIPVTFQKQSLHIVGIGDSLTEGVGDEEESSGYLGRVKEMLLNKTSVEEVHIENFGKKGDKTTNLLKKLKKETMQEEIKKADMIFLTIGANDLMKIVRNNIFALSYEPFENEQQVFANHLEEIMTVLRSYNGEAHIYYIGLYNPFYLTLPDIPEIDFIIEQWNEAARETVLRDNNASFISVQQLFEHDEQGRLLSDQIHPNGQGYTYIAEQVYEAILQDRKM